jgi:hypothetical protein
MGPQEPQLRIVGGVDHAVDQVVRRTEFLARHPQVKITGPRENGVPYWRARWLDGAVWVSAEASESRDLLDYLDGAFG